MSLARGPAFTDIAAGPPDARAGTGTYAEGGATGSGAGAATVAETALLASATSVLAACSAGAPDRARVGVTFFRRTFGGCPCRTRADNKISSFSAKGAIRHQARGSVMYRT